MVLSCQEIFHFSTGYDIDLKYGEIWVNLSHCINKNIQIMEHGKLNSNFFLVNLYWKEETRGKQAATNNKLLLTVISHLLMCLRGTNFIEVCMFVCNLLTGA